MNAFSKTFKKARFPAIMTILSLVGFLVVYWAMTMEAVEPQYLTGLLFAVPFVCLGSVTLLTAKGKLRSSVSVALAASLTVILLPAMLFAFAWMSMDAATTTTTDVGKYERVLGLREYPDNALIAHFPAKIPDNAKNVVFHYYPAFMQDGEVFALKFETDDDSVNTYRNEFSKKAKWTGKASDIEAQENGVAFGSFSEIGYDELPDDFIVYLIDSKPYHTGDWNHGIMSLAAVSGQRREVLFYADDW